jgi:hypothetical protein
VAERAQKSPRRDGRGALPGPRARAGSLGLSLNPDGPPTSTSGREVRLFYGTYHAAKGWSTLSSCPRANDRLPHCPTSLPGVDDAAARNTKLSTSR